MHRISFDNILSPYARYIRQNTGIFISFEDKNVVQIMLFHINQRSRKKIGLNFSHLSLSLSARSRSFNLENGPGRIFFGHEYKVRSEDRIAGQKNGSSLSLSPSLARCKAIAKSERWVRVYSLKGIIFLFVQCPLLLAANFSSRES